jgi:hypothetical protein
MIKSCKIVFWAEHLVFRKFGTQASQQIKNLKFKFFWENYLKKRCSTAELI